MKQKGFSTDLTVGSGVLEPLSSGTIFSFFPWDSKKKVIIVHQKRCYYVMKANVKFHEHKANSW